jgi:hypothetical protein
MRGGMTNLSPAPRPQTCSLGSRAKKSGIGCLRRVNMRITFSCGEQANLPDDKSQHQSRGFVAAASRF